MGGTMQDEKALQLFYKILAKTRSRALAWEATAEEGQYVATLGPGLILKIWPFTDMDEDGDKSGPASVTLNDDNSMLLDMNNRVDGITESDLGELFILAKRTALNIDKSVDAALRSLDELADEDIPF